MRKMECLSCGRGNLRTCRRRISVGGDPLKGPSTRLSKPWTTRKTVERKRIGYSWWVEHFECQNGDTRGGAGGAKRVCTRSGRCWHGRRSGLEGRQRRRIHRGWRSSRTPTSEQPVGSNVQGNWGPFADRACMFPIVVCSLCSRARPSRETPRRRPQGAWRWFEGLTCIVRLFFPCSQESNQWSWGGTAWRLSGPGDARQAVRRWWRWSSKIWTFWDTTEWFLVRQWAFHSCITQGGEVGLDWWCCARNVCWRWPTIQRCRRKFRKCRQRACQIDQAGGRVSFGRGGASGPRSVDVACIVCHQHASSVFSGSRR